MRTQGQTWELQLRSYKERRPLSQDYRVRSFLLLSAFSFSLSFSTSPPPCRFPEEINRTRLCFFLHFTYRDTRNLVTSNFKFYINHTKMIIASTNRLNIDVRLKIHSGQGPLPWLSVVTWKGSKFKKEGNIYVSMTDLLCCVVETNTIL